MSRRTFGWDLPPGVTHRMIEEQCEEGPCAVCCRSVDLCICPECPTCEAQGDPKCYSDPVHGKENHGLKLNKEQAISRQKARVAFTKERLMDEEMYLAQLEGDVEKQSYELSDIPGPNQ